MEATGNRPLHEAAANHRSWFGRGRKLVEVDGVSVFLGNEDAVLAFPEPNGDLAAAVAVARDSGAAEIGCWAIAPDEKLHGRLAELGFQDGWQPHWMGVDPRLSQSQPRATARETNGCVDGLPYSSSHHEGVLGGDVHHFVVDEGELIVGHAVLNIEAESGGIYDMGVAPQFRRRGHGRALVLAALAGAREAGCTSVTLNATGEGEPLYRDVGFESLGHGMTWWLFPRRR